MTNARFCIIPSRALGDKRLSHSDVMTLNALGLYGDQDGWCFPSHAEIAQHTRSHIRTVRKATQWLAECGYIEIRPRQRPDGSQASNEYRILFDYPGEQLSLEVPPKSHDALPDESPLPPGPNDPPPRANSPTPLGQATPTPLGQATPTPSILTPQVTTQKKVISPHRAKKYPDEFETFWQAWPQKRRCEKPNAYTAWNDAVRSIAPPELLAAVKRYLLSGDAQPDRHGEIFVPYPARWLKRERWLEYPASEVNEKTDITLEDLGGDTEENRGLLGLFEGLKRRRGEAAFRSWFSTLRLGRKNCSALELLAPTRFAAEWINRHYAADIHQAAREVWPAITSVVIEAPRAPP